MHQADCQHILISMCWPELSNLENFASKMWFTENLYRAITRKTMCRARRDDQFGLRKQPLTTF
jgi:hypothetical protein